MFRVQSLFETCPANGTVGFQVSVPISGMESGYEAFAILPDGSTADLPIQEGQATLEQTGGPGLHRFDVRVGKQGNRDEVAASNIVEVALIPESPQSVCDELTKAVDSMKPKLLGRGWTSDTRVVAEATALYRITGGTELPEVLRRICFDCEDKTKQWRHLLLLATLVEKPVAKPYGNIIASVVTNVLCTETVPPLPTAALDILNKVMLSPKEKWMYFTRLLAEMPDENSGAFSAMIASLLSNTPPDVRPVVLNVAREICEQSMSKVKYVAKIFEEWRYKEGIPSLLKALEMSPVISDPVCKAIRSCDSRESIPVLRDILSAVTMERGGIGIAQLLAEWRDPVSKQLLLEKLEMESQSHYITRTVRALKQYGDTSLKATIEKMREGSNNTKIQAIDAALRNW